MDGLIGKVVLGSEGCVHKKRGGQGCVEDDAHRECGRARMGLFLLFSLTLLFVLFTDSVSAQLVGLGGGGGGEWVAGVGGGRRELVERGGGAKFIDAAFSCTEEGSYPCARNRVVLFRGSKWAKIDLDNTSFLHGGSGDGVGRSADGGGGSSGSNASFWESLLLTLVQTEDIWTEISHNWRLPNPFSERIDAALNCPADGQEIIGLGSSTCRSSHVFFFSGGAYLQFDMAEGKVLVGPDEIRSRFRLPASFSLRLDAVVPCINVLSSASSLMGWALGQRNQFPHCRSKFQAVFIQSSMYVIYDLARNKVVIPPRPLGNTSSSTMTWNSNQQHRAARIAAGVALSKPATVVDNRRSQESYPRALLFLQDGRIMAVDLHRQSSPNPYAPGQPAAIRAETGATSLRLQAAHRQPCPSDTSSDDGYGWGKYGFSARLDAVARLFLGGVRCNKNPSFRRRLKATISSLNKDESQQADFSVPDRRGPLGVRDVGALAGGIVSIITIAVCVIMVCRLCWKKRRQDTKSKTLSHGSSFLSRRLINFSAAISGSLTPSGGASTVGLRRDLEFDYDVIASATNGFNAVHIIGRGTNGMVYKGWLNSRQVAIKKLAKTTGPVGKGFYDEVEALGRTNHPNLVDFMGFVADGTHDVMLVFGFLPNGSLFDHLHGRASRSNHLSWERRMSIARGIAEGLCYLHTGSVVPLVHEDVKASNVLLDKNFTARLADFGLTRLRCTEVGSIGSGAPMAIIKGNQGYSDPFCHDVTQPQPWTKSDVYAFGVLLLELISGRRPLDLALIGPDSCRGLLAWARPLVLDGMVEEIVDKRLRRKYIRQEAHHTSLLAVACIDPDPNMRPDMSHIVAALQALMEGKPWEAISPFLLSNKPLVVGPEDEPPLSTWQCGVPVGECQSRYDTAWEDSYMFGNCQNVGMGLNVPIADYGPNGAFPRTESDYGSGDGGDDVATVPRVAPPQGPYGHTLREGGNCATVGSGYVTTRGWVGTHRSSPGEPEPGYMLCEASVDEPNGGVSFPEMGSGYGSCDGGDEDATTPGVVQVEERFDCRLTENGTSTTVGSGYAIRPGGWVDALGTALCESGLGYQQGGLSLRQYIGMEYLGSANAVQAGYGYGLHGPSSHVGSDFSVSPGYSSDQATYHLGLRTGSDFSCKTEAWLSEPMVVDVNQAIGLRPDGEGSHVGHVHELSGASCGSSGVSEDGDLNTRLGVQEGGLTSEEWTGERSHSSNRNEVEGVSLSDLGGCMGREQSVGMEQNTGEYLHQMDMKLGVGRERSIGLEEEDHAEEVASACECLQQMGRNHIVVGVKSEMAVPPIGEWEDDGGTVENENGRNGICGIVLVENGQQV